MIYVLPRHSIRPAHGPRSCGAVALLEGARLQSGSGQGSGVLSTAGDSHGASDVGPAREPASLA